MLVNELLGKLDCSHAELDYIVICCDGEDTCFDGGLGVIVSEEKRLVEIFISIGRSDFLIYRREINVLYIKEMWAEIENIIDRFKQEFSANDNVAAETIFKNI